MKLDRTQRWILCNQYQILEQLARLRKDTDEVERCSQAQEALGRGFEREYGELAQGIYDNKDTLDDAGCKEVINILAMFDEVQYAYSQLPKEERAGINEHWTTFPGFDGNSEGKQMSYAAHFCRDPKIFERLKRPSDFNSHIPGGLQLYRWMLQEWEKSANKHKLTKEDLVRITNEK